MMIGEKDLVRHMGADCTDQRSNEPCIYFSTHCGTINRQKKYLSLAVILEIEKQFILKNDFPSLFRKRKVEPAFTPLNNFLTFQVELVQIFVSPVRVMVEQHKSFYLCICGQVDYCTECTVAPCSNMGVFFVCVLSVMYEQVSPSAE